MNSRGFVVVAFLVSAGLAGGAAVAFVNAGDGDSTQITLPSPTPTPSPTATATATPTATTSPTPEPTVTPTASATPSASPSATASPTATASPVTTRTYAYPRPTRQYYGLVLTSRINHGNGTTSTVFSFKLDATDQDGTIYFDGIDWGDGTKTPSAGSPQRCKSFPPLTSPPGPYQPQTDSYQSNDVYKHTYSQPGSYRVVVRVSSVNVDCRPHGPAKETRTTVFDGSNRVVVITPPSQQSSPSPSPSPSPTSSPSAG